MYKNQLQELAQRSCFNLPCYACVREGPDHAPRFRASVNFNGETFQCPFYSTTIRQAEHAAAQAALTSLSSRCPSKSLTARVLDESSIYKNLLQETVHRAGMKLPMYTTVRSGPGHVHVFTSTVDIAGISFKGDSAKSKKQAEKNAAIAAWSALKTMSNLDSLSQSSKETKTREELDQAIVANVLSNLRPRDESKLINIGDPNQGRRSMFVARGNKDTDFTTDNKLLSSFVSKSPSLTPKPSSFLKTVLKSPSPPTRRIGKSTVKIQEVSPPLDEHRRDKDQRFCGNCRVSGFSGYSPITLLDQWNFGKVTHGGYTPQELRFIAPAVQVRSVVPVCAAPPLLQRLHTKSSYSLPQPVRNSVSISSSASLVSKYRGNEEAILAYPKLNNPKQSAQC